MTFRAAIEYSKTKLVGIYEVSEAANIAEWVVDHLTGTTRSERTVQLDKSLIPEQEMILEKYLVRLLRNEPVQYVLNEAWFCGFKFYVDNNVLIPRPETEELVEWIISNCRFPVKELNILDVGSGSGCIAISLKRKIRKANVRSLDISKSALTVARKNAANLGVDVQFSEMDFLDEQQRKQLESFDIIVSNPPYVPEKDKMQLAPNVRQFEPPLALFVPDNNPLLFYETLALFGKEHLNQGGAVYVEIHEDIGQSVYDLFTSNGYKAELKKDMQGKERMVKADES